VDSFLVPRHTSPPTQNRPLKGLGKKLRNGMRPGPGEYPHGMESRPATGTAIGTDQQKIAGGVQESRRTGWANLEGAALEALRDLSASNKGHDEESDCQNGGKNGDDWFKQIKHWHNYQSFDK
jgi:hypothetical protein